MSSCNSSLGQLIPRYTSCVNSVTAKKCDKSDLELLHSMYTYDLTRTGLSNALPNMTIEECKVLVQKFADYLYFTPKETEYLTNNLDKPVEELTHELPLRTQHSITCKIRELSKRISKVKVESSELKHGPLTEDEREYLQTCINNDLTLSGLEETFTNRPIGDIIRLIKEENDSIPFTSGEKELLKANIKNKISVEECLDDFPIRDEEYVRDRYKEYDFVSTRVTHFNTPEERLVYEARWAMMMTGDSTSRRASRKRKLEEDLEEMQRQSAIVVKPVKVELTPEDIERRKVHALKIQESRERKRLEALQKRLEYQARKAAGLIPQKPRSEDSKHYGLKALVSSSEYFQSVTGDKKKVEEGQKRRRIQAEHYTPELHIKKKVVRLKTTARQAEKKKLKQELREKQKKKKLTEKGKQRKKPGPKPKKKKEVKEEYIEEEIEDDDPTSEPEEEEEDFISPYDPIDINSDTLIPLNGRQLYVPSFYDEKPSVPKLNFVNVPEDSVTSDDMTPSKKVMTDLNDDILLVDNLAAEIVATHNKQYRDLPISFPPFLSPLGKINPLNEIKVRFLLYPQHCESFILAEPKSNELDPIYEIVKLFMIHYSLYFSHSDVLREIITEDYCHKLENSVEENDFCEFMNVIDKWNTLMLKLSPNSNAVEEILSNNKDINAGPRSYLVSQEIKTVINDEDLKLETFYGEIMLESVSPSFQLLRELSLDEKNEPRAEVGPGHAVVPINVSDEVKDLKPDNYEETLFKRFQEKTTVSRFTIQQILLRVYSRIVSTDSRKLRSYKAFTAEVYGELLPSFTSEVLEKVKLLPTQKFYDLGSGVGNTTFQAALEFGACLSGGCELMEHASKLTNLQTGLIQKHLAILGLPSLKLDFALSQSFVNNEAVRNVCLDCDVLIINNYLFDGELNAQVGRLLVGLRPGTKIISLRNFISPRYRATFDTVFDYFRVEKHEMSDVMSVSWTANKVPYYISTVEDNILPEYLSNDFERSVTPIVRSGSTTTNASDSVSASVSVSATVTPQQSPQHSPVPSNSPPTSPSALKFILD
ncbi:uncharacterized protein SPAPADRAFT_140015 [Spathaspora passalidarum NRRL Y-27907]|uniref:Histone-lysine N-methyltransferase, H3 lysine-79 specific n=1 Tax=Spathaspora passalidarum (strain NRRL Y-27907 / 11-Y1) TaxID=619300 RepID=G3ARE0_SPAPN|nr:uncharacterized protein SPAPADRAFT_140015 [Spathaspora passalidarum NRRL Y-27907]EGW31747.1 hypothetical protein SPAPADRAFT_140015 [Spathaspora passalidarum NRRL Y-27907]